MKSDAKNKEPGARGQPPQDQPPENSQRTGEGAASAFAKMKAQHEHRARRQPAEDPHHHDGKHRHSRH